jgi:hypothetical protein
MEMVRLIKLCGTCGKFLVGKSLSDTFPTQNGLTIVFHLLFIEYAIRKFQDIQERMAFNGTHQLLVYGDCVNTWAKT